MTDEHDVPQIRLWGDSTQGHRIHPDSGNKTTKALLDLRDLVRVGPESVPASRVEPARQSALASLTLRLVCDDGTPLSDVTLLTEHGEITTGPDGIGMLEIPEGTHEIAFGEGEPHPLLLPPADPTAQRPAAPALLLERGRDVPFSLSTVPVGAEPKIVAIRRPRCTEVLIDGYAMGSVVMRWGGTRSRLGPDGIPVVGTCRGALRTALWLARGKQAFVVGHADPAGSDGANAAVAAARAESVFLYASGDLDGWAEHAAGNADDTDRACAAIACARIVGEPPPGLDDAQAVRRTMDVARAAAGVPPGNDASGDFRAAAALYDIDLSRILRFDLAGLASVRALVRWISTGHGELGERFPRPLVELDPSAVFGLPYALACRRSAIVVLSDPDAAALDDTQELYDGTFSRTTIEAPGEWPVRIAVLDDRLESLPRGRAWIGTDVGVLEHTAGPDGIVAFDALLGERIEVVLAADPDGDGTMTDGGTKR